MGWAHDTSEKLALIFMEIFYAVFKFAAYNVREFIIKKCKSQKKNWNNEKIANDAKHVQKTKKDVLLSKCEKQKTKIMIKKTK